MSAGGRAGVAKGFEVRLLLSMTGRVKLGLTHALELREGIDIWRGTGDRKSVV